MEGAPVTNIDRNAPKVRVGTVSGEPQSSSAEYRMAVSLITRLSPLSLQTLDGVRIDGAEVAVHRQHDGQGQTKRGQEQQGNILVG